MATEADRALLGAWAVMLDPDQNIDRHNCTRTIPMQVLCLGFSRTGTQSLQEALSILGYPTYHYSRVFANVQDADIWIPALQAKLRNDPAFNYKQAFDQVLGDYAAVTDTPSVIFWKELMEAYPDAKIVLVERDEEKWLPSFTILMTGVLNPFGRYVLRFTDPFWFGRIINCGGAWIEAFVRTLDLEQAKKNALPAYRAHYAGIRETVKERKEEGRLLEFELGGGWEPLCKFLGKEIPNVPFPKRNEAATLERGFGSVIAKALKNSARNVAVVVGVGAVGGIALWRSLVG